LFTSDEQLYARVPQLRPPQKRKRRPVQKAFVSASASRVGMTVGGQRFTPGDQKSHSYEPKADQSLAITPIEYGGLQEA
jgi:hypothetical protein